MGKDLKGKELGPGLTQRKDGMYRYRFKDYYGNTRDVYARTLSKVKQKAIEAARGDVSNPKTVASKITLNQLFDVWVEQYKKPDIKYSTYMTYKSNYNEHIRNTKLGEMPVIKITPLDVKKVFSELQTSYRQSTNTVVKSIIVQLMDFAVDEDIIMKNKIRNIPNRSVIDSRKKTPLTREQESEFLTVARETNSRYYNAFVILLNTGMRVSELCSLEMSDIDLTKRCVTIRRSLYLDTSRDGDERFVFDKTKNGHIRQVPINECTYEAFLDEIQARKELLERKAKKGVLVQEQFSNLLFLTRRLKPFYKDLVNMGIKYVTDHCQSTERFYVHTLRHTFATRCIESGIDIAVVSKYLGHSTTMMTENIYVERPLDCNELNKIAI